MGPAKRCLGWMVLGVALQGCTSWSRVEVLRETLPEQSVVELWSHQIRHVLTQVEFTRDSVVGFSAEGSSSDSCRMAFARTEVDSVRRGGLTTIGRLGAGAALGVALGSFSVFVLLRFGGD